MEQKALRVKPLWTRNFITITMVNLLIFLGFQMLMPTLPVYVKSIGGADSVIGLVTGIFTISALLTRPVSGLLLDKVGRKKVFLVGLGIYILSVFAYNWLATIALILLFRFIHGFGWGASSTSSNTIASDYIPKERFGEGMGYFSLSSSLAMAAGPAVGLYITSNYSFTLLFFISASLASLGFLLSLSLEFKEVTKKELEKKQAALYEKSSLKPSIIVFFLTITYATIVSFLSLYAAERGIQNIGMFFTVYAFSLLISRPVFGKVVDRFGFDFAVIPGLVCIFIAMILLSQASTLSMFLLVALIYGIGFGAGQSSLQTMAVVSAPSNRRGAANATFLTGFDSGIGFGSIVFGLVAASFGYSQMYIWSTVAIGLAFLLYFGIGRKK